MGMMKRTLIAISPTLYWTAVFVVLGVGTFVLEQIVDRLYRGFVRSRRGWRDRR